MRRILDPRFADVGRRIDVVRGDLSENRAAVQDVSAVAASQVDALSFLGRELRSISDEVRAANEGVRAANEGVRAASEDVRRLYCDVVKLSQDERQRAYVDRLTSLSKNAKLDELDGAAAALINFASSHRGFAAQAELWLNPPVTVEHREQSVRLSGINERIVEVPFAMRSLAHVPIGSRILDFGSSESQLSLSLATMGYKVTALDLRSYPFSHPNLKAVARPLEQWDANGHSFDAVVCVSTVEHVGLGWYGEAAGQADADRRALQRLRDLLVPGGVLVLTVPYGESSVTAVQRRYDRAALDELLAGFETLERLIVEQVDDVTWAPVSDSSKHAVALISARSAA